LLIAAHNEEGVIDARIENALAMDYPAARLEVAVASDGSTDGTVDIVRRYEPRGVRLLDFQPRRGKAAALNAAIQQLEGEILLLSDANTFTDATAARNLVRWFQDPEMGAVCGRLVLTDGQTGRNVDGVYWKYETFLKRCEGRLGGLLGANGAIYAIRKDLYTPIPDNTIVDDFVIPLLAKVRTGCSIVYDADAIAREETAPDIGAEFHRRSRIGAGGYQCIGLLWRLLNPRQGWVAFTFFSHKVLRWVCPFFLAGMLAANVAVANHWFYRFTLVAQVTFYLVAAVGAVVPGAGKVSKTVRLATLFSGMNLALFFGFWRWLSGRQQGTWRRTARLAASANGSRADS
jgi:cellulose synthase/poly-beta-1,6-N-acetylglucosamine synthase-like glycosyltransferase